MKIPAAVLGALLISSALAQGQKTGHNAPLTPRPAPVPPPVYIAPPIHSAPPVYTAPAPSRAPAPPPAQTFTYEQQAIMPAPQQPLVTPEQAQTIIDRFRTAFSDTPQPRILIFVNRELVDEQAGMKLSARTENTEVARTNGAGTTSGTEVSRVNAKNTYRVRDRKEPAMADRQTTRDIELLFGRPLRMGGARLVDQRVATQLMAGRSLENMMGQPESEQARKDRDAIGKHADVVLELLVNSKDVRASSFSGEQVYAVPDIQATAIRVTDSQIVGQATSSDIVGGGRYASRVARNHSVREIVEATALSLMQDMAQH
jgi:hypothetical protein